MLLPQDGRPICITEQDRDISSIKLAISSNETQIAALNARVRESSDAARRALAVGEREMARRYLRKKKQQQAAAARRLDALSQLQDAYERIAEAIGQVELANALKISTKILRGINAQVGDIDAVQETHKSLSDEMTKVDEVNNAMAEFSTPGPTLDEDALDQELSSLEQEELGRDLSKLQILDQLPDVPVINPPNPILERPDGNGSTGTTGTISPPQEKLGIGDQVLPV